MNTQYYRITAYHAAENTSIIMDCNGLYEQLWQFSSDLVKKGFQIIHVSNATTFLDVNFGKVEREQKYFLRATATDAPENTTHLLDGITYHAIKVADKIYIPDKSKKV